MAWRALWQREPGTGGTAGQVRDGHSSPLPGRHLLDSVVKGSLKGTDPKSPSELGSVEMSLGTQCRGLTSQRSHNGAEDFLWSDQQADRPRGGTLTWGWNCRLRPLEVGETLSLLPLHSSCSLLIHQLAPPLGWGTFPGSGRPCLLTLSLLDSLD